MTFTTPCFVKIESIDWRKEVINKLEKLGYKYYNHLGNFIITIPDNEIALGFDPFNVDIKYIDGVFNCGTNIDLFLALAAMNDENDYMQWFITNKDEWFSSIYSKQYLFEHKHTIDGVCIGVRTVRKATAEEIVEHFNNKL